ncbi:MAG: RNA methyltransferase [Acidobacteria bacterium]|nr:RNA methyltransferase [Acidobacteriota bacterium]
MERVPFQATTGAELYDRVRELPVTVLLDNVRSMYNTGAFFRTADAVRARKLLLSGITAKPPKKEITKTALGADEHVPWEHTWDPVAAVRELRELGYEIAAVETSVRAVDVFDWRPAFPVCLMFGHEVEGLQPALIEMADTFVRIPMLGMKHSLNVATAGGVVLYELLRKFSRLAPLALPRG